MDNESTDESANCLQSYSGKDLKLKYYNIKHSRVLLEFEMSFRLPASIVKNHK